MLQSIEIKNYAIISHVVVEFDKGLNIITGETGAGKSILIGALSLCLGERADAKSLYRADDKCTVEACFDIRTYKLQKLFDKLDLDYADYTTIRREISASGKSRAFINDTPVNLETLKLLASKLVNLHSQHETQELNKESYQLAILDLVAKNEKELNQYKDQFQNFQKLNKSLKELELETSQLQQDFDFYSFQLQEIIDAKLEQLSLEELEEELDALKNVESIKSKLYTSVAYLDSPEQSALQILLQAFHELKDLSNYGKDYQELANRINSCIIELDDLKKELENLAENAEFDPERYTILEQQVNEANRLLRKHQLSSLEELEELRKDLELKTRSIDSKQDQLVQIRKDREAAEKAMINAAQILHLSRVKAIPEMENTIQKSLSKIGMPNAVFQIELTRKEEYSKAGNEQILFKFNANKGFPPTALNKVASGGELSRVMLSIQALLAKNTALPSLIFDEIDTGISGEVAAKVAEVFREISQGHQLIAITHLPQIAARAEHHLFIYKNEEKNITETNIIKLDPDQHVKAIARMLSGETISEESLSNARSLINN
ncbi:MAG: DNA repair protein RecN [Chitinophagales bacterium]|nr:DNA repair protein RecN [Bacteroidota bacterium]MCB9257190.1 DNA repair protein RecN [Chitinophagales bacterium]